MKYVMIMGKLEEKRCRRVTKGEDTRLWHHGRMNICIRDDWWYTKQKVVDRHDYQYHVA